LTILVIQRGILKRSLALISSSVYVALANIVFVKLFRDSFSLNLFQEPKILLGECGHVSGHLDKLGLHGSHMFLVQRHSPWWRVVSLEWKIVSLEFRGSREHHFKVIFLRETLIKIVPTDGA
jgi:hypothetical protein